MQHEYPTSAAQNIVLKALCLTVTNYRDAEKTLLNYGLQITAARKSGQSFPQIRLVDNQQVSLTNGNIEVSIAPTLPVDLRLVLEYIDSRDVGIALQKIARTDETVYSPSDPECITIVYSPASQFIDNQLYEVFSSYQKFATIMRHQVAQAFPRSTVSINYHPERIDTLTCNHPVVMDIETQVKNGDFGQFLVPLTPEQLFARRVAKSLPQMDTGSQSQIVFATSIRAGAFNRFIEQVFYGVQPEQRIIIEDVLIEVIDTLPTSAAWWLDQKSKHIFRSDRNPISEQFQSIYQ